MTVLLFGAWLKRRRRQSDYTQAALAARAHCSAESIKKIEAGGQRPSRELAGLLADALGVAGSEREAFVHFARAKDAGAEATAFAPIPAPDGPAGPAQRGGRFHLPRPMTGFVGRERELQALCALLRQPGTALVTLSGPPGAGKTRLGLAAAELLQAEYADGVCFVPLEAVREPALVPSAIAAALGVHESSQQALTASVQAYLRAKQLLLVLDNFEQVAAAGPAVSELLRSVRGVKALITSREVLRVYGEQEFHVPALSLPDFSHLPPAGALTMYSAVELFVQRAQAVQRGFGLTPANAEAVARICTWLEGLPLAIEMAAARIKWNGPQELLDQISRRLALQHTGPRDLTPRQQTLRGAIDWSYELLSSAERRVFDQLGVFVGGCTAQALDAVLAHASATAAAEAGKAQSLATLQALVEKSLLKYDADDVWASAARAETPRLSGPPTHAPERGSMRAGLQPGGSRPVSGRADGNALSESARGSGSPPREPRYQMLETIREYAWDKLVVSGGLPSARERHARFFLQLVEEAEGQLYGPAQAAWMNRLDRESGNIRAAIGWAIESQDVNSALRLASAPLYYWTVRGRLSEAQQHLAAALSLPGALAPSPERARALNATGYFLWMLRRIPEARCALSEALAIGQASADHKVMAPARRALSLVTAYMGDYDEARVHVEEALRLSRELNDMHGYGWALVIRGDLAMREGDMEAAERAYTEGVERLRQTRNHDLLAYPLRRVGYVALRQSDLGRAGALCRESLALNMETDDKGGMAACLAQWAGILAASGLAAEGARLCGAVGAFLVHGGTKLALADQAEYERTLSALRGQLGDRPFTEAWTAGQAMSLDDAVELLLEAAQVS